MTLYPLLFHPIFKERVWGGRRLEDLYHKPLPPQVPIGESWEICDRPDDSSVIANGPLAGKNLHWLMKHHGTELLGAATAYHGRFPLLIKILDAREKLSLQVHPPPQEAATLGGEPKTEMWYVAHVDPGAELYVGLKKGVTRQEFEQKLRAGMVADCFHRVSVHPGDAMLLPSGRVHAVGAGLVIFEIQQNSDTTYRVFDWNRVGLDGEPRELHVAESLASINFKDFEPALVRAEPFRADPNTLHPLVTDELFTVQSAQLVPGANLQLAPGKMRILGLARGQLQVHGGNASVRMNAGRFCLLPANLTFIELQPEQPATILLAEAGTS